MKAQGTGEFLATLPFLFMLFAVFLVIYYNQIILLRQTRDRLDAQAAGESVSNAINRVYLAGNGTTYRLAPVGGNFTLSIRPGVVEVDSAEGGLLAYPLLTRSVSSIVLGPDPLFINNTGDAVVLSN